jgi:hypothetical protein
MTMAFQKAFVAVFFTAFATFFRAVAHAFPPRNFLFSRCTASKGFNALGKFQLLFVAFLAGTFPAHPHFLQTHICCLFRLNIPA